MYGMIRRRVGGQQVWLKIDGGGLVQQTWLILDGVRKKLISEPPKAWLGCSCGVRRETYLGKLKMH